MEKTQLTNTAKSISSLLNADFAEKFKNEASSAVRKEVLQRILSIEDFWLKARMLALINEKNIIYDLLKQRFIDADVSIVSNEDEIGIPNQLEMLVDFIKQISIKENIVPGATKAKEVNIRDSLFYLVHPKHFKAAICCYEGMKTMLEGVEDKLNTNRLRKINDKLVGILLKFNHAKEIKLGFEYAMQKRYTHFMADLIKQTGELARSKFKADYEEKKGIEGWEIAGWELVNAIEIDIQQFPEFEEIVQEELIGRFNDAGVEIHDIDQYLIKCNFQGHSKLKRKYDLIRGLEGDRKIVGG